MEGIGFGPMYRIAVFIASVYFVLSEEGTAGAETSAVHLG